MNQRMVGLIIGLSPFLLPGGTVRAQNILWRVSVKFILDANGNRALNNGVNFFTTNQSVFDEIAACNAILADWGQGYRLVLNEIVDLPGVSQWFSVDARNAANKTALENAAEADPVNYVLRDDTINIYINGDDDSGVCSLPGTTDQIILLGQGGYTTIFMHEIGHFFNLCHTQGCACGSCTEGPAACMNGAQNDDLSDTLLDRACWTRDQIAQNNFGDIYANVNANQQAAVDFTWQNVMSYHIVDPQRFTIQQMDKAIAASNVSRSAVATGLTRYVFTQGNDALDGLQASNAMRTILGGVGRAGPSDQLWITTGTYPENLFINESIILRARAGPVTIGN